MNTSANISPVRHLSPFRYPGGKTWLVPIIRRWLSSQSCRPKEFIEPFAGGGIISLTVAFEDLADHVIMAELDSDVAAVWLAILGRQAKKLADRIANFDLTSESADRILSQRPQTQTDRAFHAILRNRINHGGVMASGAGRLNYGDGKGIKSRWYPETLKQRILRISGIRNRITFVAGDGFSVISQYLRCSNCFFFLDPPYTAGGKMAGIRLYNHNDIDHPRLFEMASQLAGGILMTYENSPEVRQLAKQHDFETKRIPMKNKLHTTVKELLIGRDLSWLR